MGTVAQAVPSSATSALQVHHLAQVVSGACMRAKPLSHSSLCDPVNHSLPGSSVHGILQAGNTGVGCHAFLQGSSPPRDQSCVFCVSCIGRQVLYHEHHLEGPVSVSERVLY